jgi:hypothetical protein
MRYRHIQISTQFPEWWQLTNPFEKPDKGMNPGKRHLLRQKDCKSNTFFVWLLITYQKIDYN